MNKDICNFFRVRVSFQCLKFSSLNSEILGPLTHPFLFLLNAPFTVQVVRPTVRGFTWEAEPPPRMLNTFRDLVYVYRAV